MESSHQLTLSSLLSNFEMPILPLSEVDMLPKTLVGFQQELVNTRKATASAPQINPLPSLLPYCSTNPPIAEHVRNVVSDICPSVPLLAQAATTKDGQQLLRQWLPATGEAEDIIGFWEQEFVVD
jgi:hypothetical protein